MSQEDKAIKRKELEEMLAQFQKPQFLGGPGGQVQKIKRGESGRDQTWGAVSAWKKKDR